MNTPKYIITDWAGNVCFHGKQFDDFEDAWGFIREFHDDDEEMWQEYEVISLSEVNISYIGRPSVLPRTNRH